MPYNYGNFQNGGYTGQTYYSSSAPGMTWNQPFYQNQYSQTVPNQPVQQMPQLNQVNQQQTGNSGFVWVQGEAGAKAYPVAAGNSVLLMDSENPVLYMKSTDSSGKPLPIETYDLVKREPVSYQPIPQAPVQQKMPDIDLSNYVKNEDLEAKVMELIDKALGK